MIHQTPGAMLPLVSGELVVREPTEKIESQYLSISLRILSKQEVRNDLTFRYYKNNALVHAVQ